MLGRKQNPITVLHVVLQFLICIVFSSSILFIALSEVPRKYKILQDSSHCDADCKKTLAHHYFPFYAAMRLSGAPDMFHLDNVDRYYIYGCNGTPSLTHMKQLVQFSSVMVDYEFYLTYGSYTFQAVKKTILVIDGSLTILQESETLSLDVGFGAQKRVFVANTDQLQVVYNAADTTACEPAWELGQKQPNYFVFNQRRFDERQLVVAAVGITKYLDAAYIVLYSLLAAAFLVQIEVIAYYVYSIKRQLQESSRVAGLTQFIDVNMI